MSACVYMNINISILNVQNLITIHFQIFKITYILNYLVSSDVNCVAL